jgi:hypothetical protein
MLRLVLIAVVALLSGWTSEAAAQRRQQLQAPAETATLTLNISAKLGGKTFQATGSGSCRHAPDASIRGVSASMWMVQYGGGEEAAIRQLNLTLWRPKDGASDQVSLAVDTKSGSHRVESGGGGEDRGEATVVILPNGPGGRLEIRGKDADGKSMQVTIDCPAFAGVEAEGG